MVSQKPSSAMVETPNYMATTRLLYKLENRANACSAASSEVKVRASRRQIRRIDCQGSTRCGPTDTASRCLKADLCGLDVHGFSRWWNPMMDQSAESLAQQALHNASRHVHASEMAAACGSAFLVTTRFRSRRLHPRKSGTLEAGRWCYGRRHHRRMLRWTRDLRAREDGMNFRNPWPDVAIPDLPFSELVLQCCSARTR
jgi:hypothetical protein